MRIIDVDEMEANLRDLLRAVRGGETLRVMHDGEVVAELARPRAAAATATDLEGQLSTRAAAGDLARAGLSRDGWRWAPRGAGLDAATVEALLEDGRADR